MSSREDRMLRLRRQVEAAITALESACEILAAETGEAMVQAGYCPSCGAGPEKTESIMTMGAGGTRDMLCHACGDTFQIKGGES